MLGAPMNLDELVNSVPEVKLREQISHGVNEWKKDDSAIEKLVYLIEKWHGNVWFEDTDASNEFYARFQEFKRTAIERVGGLTLNERLYWFGLFEQWDNANEMKKAQIRTKLHANA
jgi:hypothetical protein